jgi:quercetin dioxygenase-like cupin family protein
MGATHTKVHLADDVQDAAKVHSMPPGIEAHFAKAALGCEVTGLTLFRLDAGFRTPFGHRHARQEELYVVLSGSCTVRVEDEEVPLGPLEALRVRPDAWRGIEAGPDGVEYLAFGAPADGPRDAETDPAWWPRD